jgi:hypothetical protein
VTRPHRLDDVEPFHTHAIDADPYDGHWVISLQRVSAVIKVARDGPQQGQVLWMHGGPLSDFTLVDDLRPSGWEGPAGQHTVRVVGPDRIAMFDNGLADSTGQDDMRVVEYQLDLDAMEAHVVHQRVWTGRGNATDGGSVQDLPGGGRLVGFGTLTVGDDDAPIPTPTELDAEGKEGWNLWLPGGQWSYRAWRFQGDPMTGEWSALTTAVR